MTIGKAERIALPPWQLPPADASAIIVVEANA
jgi:hypothetical protein